MQKHERGVSLIALVVTIVVLLILAGVSIVMLTGDNGIITNAQNVQVQNKKSEVTEKMKIAYNSAQTEARVKMALVDGYKPLEHLEELANIMSKDLDGAPVSEGNIPEQQGITNGYNIYYNKEEKTITMLYGDSKFALKVGENARDNLYPNIKAVMHVNI